MQRPPPGRSTPSGSHRTCPAMRMAAGLCVASTSVRPRANSASAASSAVSVSESRNAVGSSSSNSCGSRRNTRAKAIRLASPPDRPKPRSPIIVSSPMRQLVREAEHLRGFGGGVQLRIAGLRIGHAQVVGDAAVEEVRTLRGVADTQVSRNRQAARARQKPACERVEQRALAAAAGAGDARCAPAAREKERWVSTSRSAPSGRSAMSVAISESVTSPPVL